MVVAKADWLVPYSELSSGWEGVSMSTDVNMYRRMLISEGKPSLLGISLSCITHNNVKTNYYSGKWFVRVNLSLADVFGVDWTSCQLSFCISEQPPQTCVNQLQSQFKRFFVKVWIDLQLQGYEWLYFLHGYSQVVVNRGYALYYVESSLATHHNHHHKGVIVHISNDL